MTALMLTAECVLPGCIGIVTLEGEACAECVEVWGPYLHEKGTEVEWLPKTVPACGHGWWWWRNDRCEHRDITAAGMPFDCLCSDVRPNNRVR